MQKELNLVTTMSGKRKKSTSNSGRSLLGNGQFIALFLAWIIIDFLNTTRTNMICAYG